MVPSLWESCWTKVTCKGKQKVVEWDIKNEEMLKKIWGKAARHLSGVQY